MAIFNGATPDGLDLSKFQGIPKEMLNRQSLLSDFNPGRDKNLKVEFFQDSYFMSAKSAERGYPVFETKDFIRVIADDRNDFCQLIKLDAKGEPFPNVAKWLSRFPEHYKRFITRKTEGYPLSKLPGIDQGLVTTLEVMGVITVEAFIQLRGEIVELVPGIVDLQKKALKFIENQDFLEVEIQKRKDVEAELEALKAQLAAKEVAEKKKPKAVASEPEPIKE